MGHRHPFSTSQMFESENDPNWNHMNTEHPFGHLARAGEGENGSLLYPVENMFSDGMHFPSNWNPPMRSYGYSSLSHGADMPPQYPPDASGPSHDPFLHPASAGTFGMANGNYAHHPSSSSYDRRTFHGAEGGFVDRTMSNGRGLHKRKSPGIPSVAERGSSSRYYGAGSSSDLSRSTESQQEKVNIDNPHMPWDHMTMIHPSYRGNDPSSRGEGSMRNVRSRSEHDLESNLARTHLSNNPMHSSYSGNFSIDHPSTINLSGQSSSGQSSNVLAHELNHISVSPPHGRILPSDTSVFNHDPSHFLVGSSMVNASAEAGVYHHDFIPTRSSAVPSSYPGALPQTVRGVRSNYTQRSSPSFRASSSSMRFGPVIHSDEGLHLISESYPRHPRPVAGWRNSERNGRSRISNDRYRVSEETSLHDRFSSEGFMIADRPAFYGSRSTLDHHRELRLDIDNMGYEELLALGERIGHVNTGVSEDLIAKCFTETIYCSSDLNQEEGSCVICLEEYKDRDDVAALNTCRHDYHVACIKKWLSMKNSCPICKGSALGDNTKGK